jgi:bifunctional DNA-binding transcriptional regulator/antitoxin component of YhaV-PrlF toxin-antitoxin module
MINKEKRNHGMLAKLTSKNQITIPKKIMERLPPVEHFDVELRDGVVVMTPVVPYKTDLSIIRDKIRQLNLTPDSVREAIEWARRK